ncbi:MAG: aminodeoxychorismate synthase component I [Spirochaetaceae bacterium]|jgi:para-aminobenzoate synthetase/4-amino-4-deoxychorismate lyase|nr:aminodeoxychorismate synthase component I [Spirochaetaceae bacterium]
MIVYADKVFRNPKTVIVAFSTEEFQDAFKQIERYQKDYYLAGYIRYEARFAFAGLSYQKKLPLLYFEVFESFAKFEQPASQDVYLEAKSSISFEEYQYAIAAIKDEIRNGNTYEVNYTYDYHIECDTDPFALYCSLLDKQKTPYNFYLHNQYDTVLSFSPELFFLINRGEGGVRHILTKPMKGTVRRGKDAAEDEALIRFLQRDIKNRAENVMIVDLLRNDLGRIARLGAVQATRLFEVETHSTLHTMTSQVEADLRAETSLFDVFQAIFPCGSVTGAPKISTMDIIDRLEGGARNIYCGAIGLISPGGNCEFSVPIRILQKAAGDACYTYRVGGAIVWDSSAEDEWLETITKTKFLHSNFKLLETMKIVDGAILFAEEHNARIKKSADFFGFSYHDDIVTLQAPQDGMLRFLLEKSGRYTVEHRAIHETTIDTIRISPLRVNSSDIFLRHKTSYRPLFTIDYTSVYDEVFFNERNELTEGSRTNIVLKIGGRLWTPPLSSGLLSGIYRQHMLESCACSEKILSRVDLENAEEVYCVNSVRGMRRVRLVGAF